MVVYVGQRFEFEATPHSLFLRAPVLGEVLLARWAPDWRWEFIRSAPAEIANARQTFLDNCRKEGITAR